jgi:hypothetical protein
MKTRTLAIVPPHGGHIEPTIVSIHRFESPNRLQKRFQKLFPSLIGKRVIGICEENTRAVERSVIPLSMISEYALDAYMSIVYEIVAEEQGTEGSFLVMTA